MGNDFATRSIIRVRDLKASALGRLKFGELTWRELQRTARVMTAGLVTSEVFGQIRTDMTEEEIAVLAATLQKPEAA